MSLLARFARVCGLTGTACRLVLSVIALTATARLASAQNKGPKKPSPNDTAKAQICEPGDPTCSPIPQVSPYGANVNVNPGSNSYVFTVTNTGHFGTLFFSSSCSGTGVSNCGTPSPSSAALATNASTNVTVTYTGASGGGTGTVDLHAQDVNDAFTDDGWINVTVTAPPTYTVSVTPDGGSVSSDGGATISPSDTVRSTGNTTATYNLSLTWSGVSGCSVSPSQVTLSAGAWTVPTVSCTNGSPGTTGRITLKAVYAGNSAILDTGWVTTSVKTYTVSVTPDNASTTLNAGTASSQVFAVQNNGNSSATYTLSAVCSNGTTGCSSPSSVMVAAGAPQNVQNVTVNYTAGSGGTLGLVTLTASAGTGSSATQDPGTLNVSAVAPWTVAITPPTLAETSPVSVTIYWCDRSYNFSDGSRHITFKGQDVTAQFSYTNQGLGSFGCTQFYGGSVYNAVSTGTITLTGGQIIDSLSASINDQNGTLLSATRAWQPLSWQVAVTPHGGVAAPAPNQVNLTQAFQIRNNGNGTPSSYALAVVCTGAVSNCSAPSSIVVSPGAENQQSVNVTYTSGTTNSLGTIQLAATAGAFSDAGTVNVRAASSGEPVSRVLATEINPGVSIDRASCLVFALVHDVASECGALRITHPLPAVRTLGQVRTPTLVYYSDQLDTTSLAVHFILADTATIPDSVRMDLWDVTSGSSVALAPSRTYGGSAWTSPNRKQRLTASRILKGSTRIIKYQVAVRLKYGAQWKTDSIVGNGELAVVNRSLSRFGAGWWLAGIERLYPGQYDGSVLWVEGDGSTRKYVQGGTIGGETAYLAEAVRRPDTLFLTAQGGFRRSLPNGTNVYFTSQGLDTATVNLLGYATKFGWNTGSGEPQLASITVPGASTTLQYTFQYDDAGQLSCITAPVDPANGARQLTIARNPSGTGITHITGPDATSVGFTFQTYAPDRLYLTRTDRRATPTTFGFEPSSPTLASNFTAASATQNVIDSLTTVIGVGASPSAGPTAVDSVYARYVSPHRDASNAADQVTKFWLDRFGAPVIIVDAIGDTSRVRRDDYRFPGLITRVESPVYPDSAHSQRVRTATFDSHGNVKTVADLRPYFPTDSIDAVTRFEYDDPNWRTFMTRIVPPEGDSTVIAYNTNGTRASDAPGGDPSRQTNYSYYSSGNTPNLLYQVYSPSTATLATGTDSIHYDALGNPDTTWTPLATWRGTLSDAIGRPIKSFGKIYADSTHQDSVVTAYDVMDRVIQTTTYGPVTNSAAKQTIWVYNFYNSEGQLDSIARAQDPQGDGTHPPLGRVVTGWRYDNLGRRTAEVQPDNTPNTLADNPVESTFYSPNGNVDSVQTSQTDQISGSSYTIKFTYDRLNRLTTRTVPNATYRARYEGLPMRDPPITSTRYNAPYPLFYNNSYTATPTEDPSYVGWGGYTITGEVASFDYDVMGNLIRADNADAQIRRAYYPNGLLRYDTLRIQTLDHNDTTKHVYVLQYLYDLDGRVATLKHPPALGSYQTSFAYDWVTGALRTVIDPLGNGFTYGYDQRSELVTLTMPRNTTETYSYDEDGRLTSLLSSDGSTTYHSVTMTYNLRDKQTGLQNSAGAKDTIATNYAGLGQVEHNTHTSRFKDGSTRVVTTESFSHYPLGDLAAHAIVKWVYSPPNSNTPTYPPTPNTSTYYEPGTGRLLASTMSVTGSVDRHDTTEYDRAGNILFTTQPQGYPAPTFEDRASYYGADGRLYATDYRREAGNGSGNSDAFEEYRYDALGRRVWVRARLVCGVANDYSLSCLQSYVRRTVWAGSQELYEIQAPDSAYNMYSTREYDTQTPPIIPKPGSYDANPYYGIVAYTYGLVVDKPLSIMRINLRNYQNSLWSPFSIIPLWTPRGYTDTSYFAATGASNCVAAGQCVTLNYPETYFAPAYGVVSLGDTITFAGTLMNQKSDHSGLLYRRNRYYDPATGRFTQEDPIGLAGGLNVYGFANGDPVNFSDAFGLSPDTLETITVEQKSKEIPQQAERKMCLDKSVAGNAQSLYNDARAAGMPVVFNNAYRDRPQKPTGGRPGAGTRSQHLAGFAFDINSSLLTPEQNAQFTAMAAGYGFKPVSGDPGHYQTVGGAQAVYGTHAAGVAEAQRSYAAGECTDANVEAMRK